MYDHDENSPAIGSSPVAELARAALIHAARKLGYEDGFAAPGPFTNTTVT